MLDPMPGTKVPASALRMFNGLGGCGNVLLEGAALAEALSRIYVGLCESTDQRLITALGTDREDREDLEGRINEAREGGEEWAEARRVMARADEAGREATETMRKAEGDLQGE
jgi:hypothetical protein